MTLLIWNLASGKLPHLASYVLHAQLRLRKFRSLNPVQPALRSQSAASSSGTRTSLSLPTNRSSLNPSLIHKFQPRSAGLRWLWSTHVVSYYLAYFSPKSRQSLKEARFRARLSYRCTALHAPVHNLHHRTHSHTSKSSTNASIFAVAQAERRTRRGAYAYVGLTQFPHQAGHPNGRAPPAPKSAPVLTQSLNLHKRLISGACRLKSCPKSSATVFQNSVILGRYQIERLPCR